MNREATAIQAASTSPAAGVVTSAATVSFASNPDGADIEVDGIFLGSTPAELPLALGQRTVRLSKKGFRSYQRTIQVLGGGAQRIAVDLEPE